MTLIIFFFVLAGCGGQQRVTLVPTIAVPGQTAAAPGSSPTTAASQPGISEPGSDWKNYTDSQTGATIRVPPAWVEQSAGQVAGADGFARLEFVDNDGAGDGAVCQVEANRDKPGRYGALPQIIDLGTRDLPACLILPSADQPPERRGEGLYLRWMQPLHQPGKLLALHADSLHIQALVKSLQAGGEVTQVEGVKGQCDFNVSGLKNSTVNENGMLIDEFPMAKGAQNGCSPLLEPGEFSQRASQGAPAAKAQEVIDWQWSGERLEALNARLQPFDYKVETYDQLFRVLKGGQVARANIYWIGQLTIRADGSDFLLPIVDSYNATTYIVRSDGVHALDEWNQLLQDNIFPVFVGGDTISLAYDFTRYPRQPNQPALVNVLKNGQVIDTLSVSGSTPATGPVRALWAWQDHWVLELPGVVVEDGRLLNQTLGYSEMFTWRIIQGQPFYFFRKAGKVQMAYANQALPGEFDEVLYEPQWTSRMLVQLKEYEHGVLFYARRGDVWYYVVAQGE